MTSPVRRPPSIGAVDALVAALIVGTAAFQLSVSRDFWFFYDEWIAADLSDRGTGLLEPYNGHLSVIWLATYRAVFGLWGLEHYLPLRVLGVVALAAAPAVLYLTTRRRLGPPLPGRSSRCSCGTRRSPSSQAASTTRSSSRWPS